MIYSSSFMLSNKQVKNPNIYPYNVFRGKYIEPFVFSPITVFYGNNGSGKSTLLNIIANKLQLKGKEYATSNSFGIVDYCNAFSNECSYSLGEDDFGFVIKQEEYIKFAQEKYSNGETSMQYFEEYLYKIIYVFLTIFLYLLKCPQSLILSALRAFCFCGKPHISRSIFLYFRYQAWLKSW